MGPLLRISVDFCSCSRYFADFRLMCVQSCTSAVFLPARLKLLRLTLVISSLCGGVGWVRAVLAGIDVEELRGRVCRCAKAKANNERLVIYPFAVAGAGAGAGSGAMRAQARRKGAGAGAVRERVRRGACVDVGCGRGVVGGVGGVGARAR